MQATRRNFSAPAAENHSMTRRSSKGAILLAVAAVAWVPRLAGAEGRTVGDVLAELATDPTIDEVQRAALRQAALEPRRVHSLLGRLRWAAALPRVEVSLSRGFERDEDIDRAYQELDELSLATDEDLDLRCTVRWDLDRLVYDPEELRASRQAADLSRRRRELLIAVTRLYYELLLLRAEQRSGGAVDPSDEIGRALRMAELRATLDGLTGGLLSRARQR